MAKTKPDRVCADCIHFHACQSWTSGILDNTDARPCRNYETIRESNAYYLGFKNGKQVGGVDADERNKPKYPVPDLKATGPDGLPLVRCAKCGYAIKDMERYCPYCGQRLAKEE